jgi:hypothetical protein
MFDGIVENCNKEIRKMDGGYLSLNPAQINPNFLVNKNFNTNFGSYPVCCI